MSGDEEKECFPIMAVAQKKFSLEMAKKEQGAQQAALATEVKELVVKSGMLPYYEKYLAPNGLIQIPEAEMAAMRKRNEEELAKLEEKLTDAKENLGDVEVRDALLAKADFFNRVGDKDEALAAYKVCFEKTVGIGGKLDIILTNIRIGFFFEDKELAKNEIEKAKLELKKGGDWERRNKLKVYEGIHLMNNREWKEAATLFLNVMPTFTATELVDFKDFISYTIVLTMVACDRPTIREKLVHSPEVLSVIQETPALRAYMDSYFGCKYADFQRHFVDVIDILKADRYLNRHLRFYVRAMRLNAYKQFLASYRSVTLEAMGTEFGVSPAFIDSEISSFISSGKLTCKIDKVSGLIDSTESDTRSQVYVEIIKQGDLLLNRMQKLSGAIDM